MVMAWGGNSIFVLLASPTKFSQGYIFIINLIPLYVVLLVFIGNYSTRLYIAYSSFYVMGTLLAMQIAFVGSQHSVLRPFCLESLAGFNAVQSSEHMAAMGTFLFLQIFTLIRWVKTHLQVGVFCLLLFFICILLGFF